MDNKFHRKLSIVITNNLRTSLRKDLARQKNSFLTQKIRVFYKRNINISKQESSKLIIYDTIQKKWENSLRETKVKVEQLLLKDLDS